MVFKLYDTYGFPVDLTADIAREQGIILSILKALKMKWQSSVIVHVKRVNLVADYSQTHFDRCYVRNLRVTMPLKDSAMVVGLFGKDQATLTTLKAGEQGAIVLAHTPFYAESGGQVGDKGVIQSANGEFTVEDTQKWGDAIVHLGVMKQGSIAIGDALTAKVDPKLRQSTRLNHSATHLLHAALREILGTHVIQKGSLVAPDRLRFDFSHFEPLNLAQLDEIEKRVNEKILENTEAKITVMSPEEAMKSGAMALFGEKYGDKVRVLNMGHGYSVELCGGTHVDRTGDIGLFKITAETGIAAGIRRIEGITGMAALDYLNHSDRQLNALLQLLKTDKASAATKVSGLLEQIKDLDKQLARLKGQLATQSGGDLSAEAKKIGDIQLLVKILPDVDIKIMRELIDDLKNKWGKAIIVLATVNQGKVQLIVGVTANCTGKISAGELVNFIAQQVGGKGGGRADLAQAGGTEPANLENALAQVENWVRAKF